MKKRKTSNIIFWTYLIFVYLSFIGALVFFSFNLQKESASDIDLSGYSSVINVQPFDTLVLRQDGDIMLKYSPDTNLVAFNSSLDFRQTGKTLELLSWDGNTAIVTGDEHLVVVADSVSIGIASAGFNDLQIIARNAKVDIASGSIKHLTVTAYDSDFDIALAMLKKLQVDLHNSAMDVATVSVRNIEGYADSLSVIRAEQLFDVDIDIHGGGQVENE